MVAAIAAKLKAPKLKILIVDKNAEPGRKLCATGNGRCNISNKKAKNCNEVLEFLDMIGVATHIFDDGHVYPHSESAKDIVNLLEKRLSQLGCELITNAEVMTVQHNYDDMEFTASKAKFNSAPCSYGKKNQSEHGFFITYKHKLKDRDEKITVEKCVYSAGVILSSGGKAGSVYGADGSGFRIAEKLGHNVKKPIPVLAPVECMNMCSEIAGTRAKGTVSLYKDRDLVFKEYGEIQFTEYGLSGIAIFNATRMMRFDESRGIAPFEIALNLFPEGNIEEYLRKRRDIAQKIEFENDVNNCIECETVSDILITVIKKKAAIYILECAGVNMDKNLADLSDDEINSIAGHTENLTFKPSAIKGWKYAQCTSGGVLLEELNPTTFESLKVPGLYITGELQDYDGKCGGYNLNHAIYTGISAGMAIAENHIKTEYRI